MRFLVKKELYLPSRIHLNKTIQIKYWLVNFILYLIEHYYNYTFQKRKMEERRTDMWQPNIFLPDLLSDIWVYFYVGSGSFRIW